RIFQALLAGFRLSVFIDEIKFKIKVYGLPGCADSKSRITSFFCCARCNVARNKITESGVSSLEIIISFFFRNFIWLPVISLLFWYPNAAIIPQGFRHQRQL